MAIKVLKNIPLPRKRPRQNSTERCRYQYCYCFYDEKEITASSVATLVPTEIMKIFTRPQRNRYLKA